MGQVSAPSLEGDFALVPLDERLRWRYALAAHLVKQMDLPEWKREEQLGPLNLTIAHLVEKGVTSVEAIKNHILKTG